MLISFFIAVLLYNSMSQSFPLRSLHYYKVVKDFRSHNTGKYPDQFLSGMVVQYQRTISNTYDMLEILHFTDMQTQKQMIWEVRIEVLDDDLKSYLQEVSREAI